MSTEKLWEPQKVETVTPGNPEADAASQAADRERVAAIRRESNPGASDRGLTGRPGVKVTR